MPAKHVVVDGSNIATEGRTTPSLQQLDEAVRAFMAEYPHDILTVVVDATFGHRIDASERDRYEEAVLAGELISPPAGAIGRGDAFVLQIADKADANVFSNDSFQEFHGDYLWLFDEGRLIGGKPVEHVGWIFLPRTPVRGPVSRKATRVTKPANNTPAISADGPPPVPSGPPPRKSDTAKDDAEKTAPSKTAPAKSAPTKSVPAKAPSSKAAAASSSDAKGDSKSTTDPINAPMTFIEFISAHPVGSEVTGTVGRFSSHGAYIEVDEAECYIPLKAIADPAPRSARDIFNLGETRAFIVESFDTPRRGIDLILPPGAAVDSAKPAEEEPAPAKPATKAAVKKAAAKKAPAKKAVAKKAPAKKATPAATKKAAPAAKAAAPAKKAPAAKKTVAKKAPAKAASATKKTAVTKKAAPAKQPAAKKAPAKMAAVKKAAAKKAPVKKAPAKKAVAKKAPAQKAASPES